jgi:hypothetical protein
MSSDAGYTHTAAPKNFRTNTLFQMNGPVNHTSTPAAIICVKYGEPGVFAKECPNPACNICIEQAVDDPGREG